MTSLTGYERIPSYEQVAYRETNRKRRARVVAAVSAEIHLRDSLGMSGLTVLIAGDPPDQVKVSVLVAHAPKDRRELIWKNCRLAEAPGIRPGLRLFTGRIEEEWPEGTTQGESRAEDIRVGREFGRRAERVVMDEMCASLYGHLQDDLGVTEEPLSSEVVPRIERWSGSDSLTLRHPDTPQVRLSEPAGASRFHADLVSDVLPAGGVIVCDHSYGGLATAVRASYPRTWRRRIRLAVDYSWAVTAPETFRLFTAA